MVNNNLCLKIPALALIFGFIVICGIEAQTDSRLNGKWSGVVEGIESELSLNNGNYESTSNGIPDSRGTYIANNGEFALKPTHVFGESVNVFAGFSVIEAKWYAINEFIIAIKAVFTELGLSEDIINQLIHIMISPPSSSYSVDANTLILTSSYDGNKEVVIFTKR